MYASRLGGGGVIKTGLREICYDYGNWIQTPDAMLQRHAGLIIALLMKLQ
jgi:hypothetical protein